MSPLDLFDSIAAFARFFVWNCLLPKGTISMAYGKVWPLAY